MIDIDELECTVFGNSKPYNFGQTKNHWKIKDFGFSSQVHKKAYTGCTRCTLNIGYSLRYKLSIKYAHPFL